LEKYTDRYTFARVKKSERTRGYIVSKTAEVFNKQGYRGTSLSDLELATGLSKGSLYGNFLDKEEIAREAFYHSMAQIRNFVCERLSRQKTARGKLIALLSFYAAYVFNPPIPGGCPLLNTAVEADDFNPPMRTIVSDEIEKTITAIIELLELGKRSGEFVQDFKSRELATLFFASVEGALMVSRVSGSDRAMKIVVRHCKSILDQITTK
jgi:TetR/AcrR family transcriptional regulator, transcriptional repressor for nem operon